MLHFLRTCTCALVLCYAFVLYDTVGTAYSGRQNCRHISISAKHYQADAEAPADEDDTVEKIRGELGQKERAVEEAEAEGEGIPTNKETKVIITVLEKTFLLQI